MARVQQVLIAMAAVLAASDAPAQNAPQGAQVQLRDGQHDFDWEFGSWTTKVRVLRNPLSRGVPDWAEYQGTSVVRPPWICPGPSLICWPN